MPASAFGTMQRARGRAPPARPDRSIRSPFSLRRGSTPAGRVDVHIRSAPSVVGRAGAGAWGRWPARNRRPAEEWVVCSGAPASLSSCTWQVRPTTCRAGDVCPLRNSAAPPPRSTSAVRSPAAAGQAQTTSFVSEHACAPGTTASVFKHFADLQTWQ